MISPKRKVKWYMMYYQDCPSCWGPGPFEHRKAMYTDKPKDRELCYRQLPAVQCHRCRAGGYENWILGDIS